MFRNYLKTAFRIHTRNRVYSAINFLGLSVALMICFLTFFYVQDEFTHDAFHAKSDQLFLIHLNRYTIDNPQMEAGLFDVRPLEGISKNPVLNLPLIQSIQDQVPEIEELVRVERTYRTVLQGGEEFSEGILFVDTSFFEAFSFDFLKGDRATALNKKANAVITETFALKHFGTTDVIGETITVAGDPNDLYEVAGVIDQPENTTLSLNLIVPLENSNYYENNQDNWGYNAISAFAVLNDPSQREVAAQKIRNIYLDYIGSDRLEGQREMLKLSEDNPVYDFGLTNIADLYLDPTVSYGKSSSPLYSYILLAISLVILLIASINYLSISIASSAKRRVEIAVRKVVGAKTGNLRQQFYLESLALTELSVLGGFTLMQLVLPLFNELSGKELSFNWYDNLTILGYGLFFGLFISVMAGGYPAQVLSRFKILNSLKGETHKIRPALIKSMVVFQFTLCLVFISVSLVMQKQFQFINSKDLGFDKDQMVMVGGIWGQAELLRQEVSKSPHIQNAGSSSGIFIGGGSISTLVLNSTEYRLKRVRIGEEFLETLGVKFLDISGMPKPGEEGLIEGKQYINETYYNLLKTDSVMFNALKGDIGGVVNDFHFETLQTQINPISFRLVPANELSSLFVKLSAGEIEQGIKDLESAYLQVTGKSLKEIRFMDDFLNRRYKDSQKWRKIISAATSIGIIIACIGLFGLTGINMDNRMKELSIRKVLGANYNELAFLLNRQTLMLILFSTLISIPLSYYFMKSWLSGFAYHINISADMFAFAFLVLLVIALLTVTFHTLKCVRTNPAEILRNE